MTRSWMQLSHLFWGGTRLGGALVRVTLNVLLVSETRGVCVRQRELETIVGICGWIWWRRLLMMRPWASAGKELCGRVPT